ncbi:hypothetical protein WA1_14850 [Scytonema hofmannii PCC 7110]|uniref:Circadian input-output histidine kinase CikA n=1 Tax=Scytonema hofmannii PCC 7110 TaxID=128403 RepID=A0A139XD53_9CYAN|nr:PAS domain S-box protein [Scytonema hofmannii]KYC42624.1 hypothetical protein WA1_14850 [Scytonema hofmannii PCC 7110]
MNVIKSKKNYHLLSQSMAISLQLFSKRISLAVIFIGGIVFLGWLLNISLLKSILPGMPSMKVNTAVCFILTGASLWLWHQAQNHGASLVRKFHIGVVAQVVAAIAILISLLTLIQYSFHVNLGIDELLLQQPEPLLSKAIPGRMSPNTAINFFNTGTALVLLNTRCPNYRAIQGFAGLAWLMSYLGLMGYVYNIFHLYAAGIPREMGMAIHTAFSFLLLSSSILCALPDKGIMPLLAGKGMGCQTARRLLPFVFVIYPMVASLCAIGSHFFLYTKETERALIEILDTFLLSGGVLWNTYALNKTDYHRLQAEKQLTSTNQRLQLELEERQRAEEALQAEQARFASILDIASDAIIAVDGNQQITLFNQGAEKIFGYAAGEVIGQNLLLLLPSRYAKVHHHHVNSFSQSDGKARRMGERGEIFGRRKDGTEFSAEASISKLEIDNEKIFTAIVRDITVRKQAEVNLFQLAAIVKSSEDAIISNTLDGTIMSWNDGAQKLFGYTATEAIGQSISLLFPCDRTDEALQNIEKIRCGETVENYETIRKRKDGKLVDIALTISPVLDATGKIVGASKIARNITERKQADRELKQAKEAAEVANRAKSAFLASMSHELRTPMNVILGFAQVMSHDKSLSLQQQEHLKIISRSGDHLLNLINDVLDFSKIEADRITLDESSFDLIDLVESVAAMLKQRTEVKGLSFSLEIAPDVPQYVITDGKKLRQVLLNLLGNAIKFTNEGGVMLGVKVEWGQASGEKPSQSLCFEIKDTGVGIASDELDTIFDAFMQTQSGKISKEGTGLGLSISRKFVQLMGGDISVHSTLGEGSTFTFEIPVSIVPAALVQQESTHRQVIGLISKSEYRILVVDDQPENRLLLVELMTHLGLEVREASNGQEAFKLWQEWQPHLIWMDIQMPVMDGYETAQKIRAENEGDRTIIIALSAHASQSDRSLAIAVGCNDYITKPVREEFLYAKMADYLGLQYIYEQQKKEISQKSLSDSELQSLLSQMPSSWVTQLYQAAQLCDDKESERLLAQIPEQFVTITSALQKLVHDFRFEIIVKILENWSNSQSTPILK